RHARSGQDRVPGRAPRGRAASPVGPAGAARRVRAHVRRGPLVAAGHRGGRVLAVLGAAQATAVHRRGRDDGVGHGDARGGGAARQRGGLGPARAARAVLRGVRGDPGAARPRDRPAARNPNHRGGAGAGAHGAAGARPDGAGGALRGVVRPPRAARLASGGGGAAYPAGAAAGLLEPGAGALGRHAAGRVRAGLHARGVVMSGRAWAWAAFVVVLAVGLYWPAVHVGFLADDVYQIALFDGVAGPRGPLQL